MLLLHFDSMFGLQYFAASVITVTLSSCAVSVLVKFIMSSTSNSLYTSFNIKGVNASNIANCYNILNVHCRLFSSSYEKRGLSYFFCCCCYIIMITRDSKE